MVTGGKLPRVLIQGTKNQSLCHVLHAVEHIEQNRVQEMEKELALREVQNLASGHRDKVPVIGKYATN